MVFVAENYAEVRADGTLQTMGVVALKRFKNIHEAMAYIKGFNDPRILRPEWEILRSDVYEFAWAESYRSGATGYHSLQLVQN